jgi:hypothetical protein
MIKGGESPEKFDVAFKGKIVEEPKGMVDVLRIVVQRSEN